MAGSTLTGSSAASSSARTRTGQSRSRSSRWNTLTSSLLYVAEKKRPKTVPFLGQGEVPATAEVPAGIILISAW